MDELAIAPTISNGKEEMTRCEQVFKQVCFLAERFWPNVDGMGEDVEDGSRRLTLSVGQGNPNASENQNDENGFSEVLDGSPSGNGASA